MLSYLEQICSQEKNTVGRISGIFLNIKTFSRVMKKELIFVILFVFLLAYITNLAGADFSYINSNIQSNYIGGQNIVGTLNISLQNEPSNALLTSNLNGNISLLNFLQNNSLTEGKDYNCSSPNCLAGYSLSGTGIMNLPLSSNGDTSIGFKLTGTNVQVTKASISLASNIGSSCSNELQANILGNDSIWLQSGNYINQTCGVANRGCFDMSAADKSWITLGQDEFCERINLPVAPAFQVGAQIKMDNGASGNIIMNLFDSNWNNKGTCTLPVMTQTVQNVSCVMAAPNSVAQNYFLCISNNGASGFYVDSEGSSPVCGNSGTNFNNYVIDYDVYAQALKFASPNLIINETNYQQATGNSLAGVIDNYISGQYNRDCSGNGCIIPIELLSTDAQSLNITNAEVDYMKAGTGSSTTQQNSVYSLQKTNSTLNSGQLSLDLSKSGISIPLSTNATVLQLYLNGAQVLPNSQNINITNGFDFNLTPQNALIGVNTIFYLTSLSNIISVLWKFGDGSNNIVTNITNVNHRYNREGQYNLEADATSFSGLTIDKNITVTVGDPKTSASVLLQQSQNGIGNVSLELNSYDSWIKTAISNNINLTDATSYVNTLQDSYNNNGNYSDIVNALVALQIPDAILTSNLGTLPLAVGFNNIDPSYALVLAGNDSSSASSSQLDELKQNIINWNFNNYNTTVDYKVISEQIGDSSQPIYTYFRVTINSGADAGNANLIINYPESGIIFKQNYGAVTINSGSSSVTSIPITSGTGTIEFLLPGEVQVSELGAYISPGLDKLGYSNTPASQVPQNTRPWTATWLYILLAVALIVVYISLQEWYKKRYESHLFKNRDDLYNLVNFIYNSRASGMSDNDIRKKLSSYNWKSEQISYSFRKIDGKRTGMWEIPIFKFLENRKVKQEIEKRQQPIMGGGRFIKSQY